MAGSGVVDELASKTSKIEELQAANKTLSNDLLCQNSKRKPLEPRREQKEIERHNN